MTFTEAAASMRKLADDIDAAVKRVGQDATTGYPQPVFDEPASVGAAWMLCYLRDIATRWPPDEFSQGSFLVLLEQLSHNSDVFPFGLAEIMWAADGQEGDAAL